MNGETKIPNNLYECLKELDSDLMEYSDREWLREADESKLVAHTMSGLGEWIKTNWGLTSRDSNLFEYFNKLGLNHADDISAVIVISYHRYLNKEELRLDEQIKKYVEFWKNQKLK